MLDEYLGEDLFGVRYLSAAQQAAFRLTVRDGLLLDARGERFDTTGSGTVVAGAGFAIFVMSARGAIFASRVHEDLVFHHSSLVAGQAVAAAGEIMVTDGILQHVTDRSGHYLPPPHLTAQFLRVMERRGVCLDAVVVESICSPHTDARSFSIHHGRVAAPGSDEDPRRQD